jgi:hypothetical protein
LKPVFNHATRAIENRLFVFFLCPILQFSMLFSLAGFGDSRDSTLFSTVWITNLASALARLLARAQGSPFLPPPTWFHRFLFCPPYCPNGIPSLIIRLLSVFG